MTGSDPASRDIARRDGLQAWLARMARPRLRVWLAGAHDLAMTAISLWLATWLRIGPDRFSVYIDDLLLLTPVLLVIAAFLFHRERLYQGIWRFASTTDLVRIARAVTLVILAFLAVTFLIARLEPIPRSVPIIQWFMLLILLGGGRFAYRMARDGHFSLRGGNRTPILLIGAQEGAALFLRSQGGKRSPYRAVGIVSRSAARVGQEINSVPVLGTMDDIAGVVAALDRKGNRPEQLVLTKRRGEIGGDEVRDLMRQAEALGLPISRMGQPEEFQTGALDQAAGIRLQPIALEDLLGRPQARLERSAIQNLVVGRRVLVTGGGGTIGGELCRQIAALGPARLDIVDFGEFNLYAIDNALRSAHPDLPMQAHLADIRRRDRLMAVFADCRPDIVFHAAALKHVPLVELNPAEGILTNTIGTRNVADAAASVRAAAMVTISTDKAVRPTNVMGASKRVAELICQSRDAAAAAAGDGTRFMTVRFGNVLGSSGSVVPLFQRQLAAGGPITVTHPEMRRYFMTVAEAVELVLQASAHGLHRPDLAGKIFVLDMGEPVRIVDLARQMIRLAGQRPDEDVKIVFTGLRPGEKLFEEILDPSEEPVPSAVDGVVVASPALVDRDRLETAVNRLMAAAASDDRDAIGALLAGLVPGYEAPVARLPGEESPASAPV